MMIIAPPKTISTPLTTPMVSMTVRASAIAGEERYREQLMIFERVVKARRR